MIDLLKIAYFTLSACGAYFWIRRNVWSSPSSIADFAKTRFDYNDQVVKELSAQRADSLVAWVCIFLSTATQAMFFFIPSTIHSFSVFGFRHVVYFLAVGISTIQIGNIASRKIENVLVEKTINLIEKNEQ